VEHVALLVLKNFCFISFYSHVYFRHFEKLTDNHFLIHESFMFYHMCVFDITSLILRGRQKKKLLTFFFFFFMSYIEGEILFFLFLFLFFFFFFFFYHNLAFHSLCIHSFDHVYVLT
jgi:hypothetical protein